MGPRSEKNYIAPRSGDTAVRLSMRTQQLAALAGTTPRALRHYHKLGLLPEKPRDPNGYRSYDIYDLVRVVRIRQLSAAGVPLRKVSGLLDEENQQPTLEVLRQVEGDLRKQLELLQQQRSMISSLIRQEETLARLNAANSRTAKADRDMFTLAITSTHHDDSLLDQVVGAAANLETSSTFAAWYQQFLALENSTTISAHRRKKLKEHASESVELMRAQLPPSFSSSNTEDDQALLTYFQEIASDSFSPAQFAAWNDLLAIMRSTPTPE